MGREYFTMLMEGYIAATGSTMKYTDSGQKKALIFMRDNGVTASSKAKGM